MSSSGIQLVYTVDKSDHVHSPHDDHQSSGPRLIQLVYTVDKSDHVHSPHNEHQSSGPRLIQLCLDQ